MSKKIELEWFSTEEKAHPDTPETDRRCPKVWCLVDRVGLGIVARPWDCVSECWNDEDDDDYECGVEGVKGWAIIPEAII